MIFNSVGSEKVFYIFWFASRNKNSHKLERLTVLIFVCSNYWASTVQIFEERVVREKFFHIFSLYRANFLIANDKFQNWNRSNEWSKVPHMFGTCLLAVPVYLVEAHENFRKSWSNDLKFCMLTIPCSSSKLCYVVGLYLVLILYLYSP